MPALKNLADTAEVVRPIDTAEIVQGLPKLCTRAEAAAVLRRKPRTIDRWAEAGLIKTIRPAGGYPLVPRSEIERLLAEAAR